MPFELKNTPSEFQHRMDEEYKIYQNFVWYTLIMLESSITVRRSMPNIFQGSKN